MRSTLIILLIGLLFTGCSSTPKKEKSFLTEDQKTQLRAIFDRHMTDDDWASYQQNYDKYKETINLDSDIVLKNDYDKDPQILMYIMQMSYNNRELYEELTSFIYQEIINEETNEQLEDIFK